jgi:hypothetical protein
MGTRIKGDLEEFHQSDLKDGQDISKTSRLMVWRKGLYRGVGGEGLDSEIGLEAIF